MYRVYYGALPCFVGNGFFNVYSSQGAWGGERGGHGTLDGASSMLIAFCLGPFVLVQVFRVEVMTEIDPTRSSDSHAVRRTHVHMYPVKHCTRFGFDRG